MITSFEVGQRIKQYRLNQNISQDRLAKLSKLSRNAIAKAEKGLSVLGTYIAIMKALGRIDALESAFPEELDSPIQMLERNKQKRLRAYNRKDIKRDDNETVELDW